MKEQVYALLLGIVLFIPAAAFPETRTVSLKECISIALENHPDIKSSSEEKKKARANYRASKSTNKIIVDGELRTVEYLKADTSAGKVAMPGRDTTFGIFAGARATYNLYDANKKKKQQAAKINVSMAHVNERKTRSTIELNVKSAYYTYSYALEHTRLKGELEKRYSIKLQKTQLLFKNGQRPVQDVTKAEVDMASARLELERARNQEKLAKIELLAALGVFNGDIEIKPVVAKKLPELRFTLAELYKIAEENYPDLRISKMKKVVQRINIDVQKSLRSPSIDIYGSFGFENKNLSEYDNFTDNFTPGNWDPTFHAGIQARVPIYSGGLIPGKIDAAKAEYRKSLYDEKKLLLNMKSLIKNYVQAMMELKNQIELSRLMKENAEKHLSFAQKSYDHGIGSQLELQDAESALINAEIFSVKAKYDYLATLAKLSNTVGVGEDFLCK